MSTKVEQKVEQATLDFSQICNSLDTVILAATPKIHSTYSLYYLLNLVLMGAKDGSISQKKLSKFLGVPKGGNLAPGILGLTNQLKQRDTIQTSNLFYIKDTFVPKKEYRELLRSFGSIKSHSFDSTFVPEVNGWVNDQTNGQIKSLLTKEDISKDSVMVLLNTIYFKDEWKYKFLSNNTQPRSFTNNGTELSIPFLNSSYGKQYNYYMDPGGNQMVTLKYISGLEMNIYLPAKSERLMSPWAPLSNSLKESEDNFKKLPLSSDSWYELLKKQNPHPGSVSIPKFRHEVTIDGKDLLSQLGVTEIFDPTLAKLTKIHDEPGNELYVSKIIQKAFIDVDENGTEASAISFCCGVNTVGYIRREPFNFVADHPFQYAIRDPQTNLILFSGIFNG